MRVLRLVFLVILMAAGTKQVSADILPPTDTLCSKFIPPSAPKLFYVSWQDIEFSNHNPDQFQRFMVVTNRELIKRKNQLIFSNYRDKSKTHYLVITEQNGKWLVSEKKNFEEACYAIDDMGPLLFYVHGYGKTFPGVISEGAAIRRFYKVTLIIFDWPSRNPEFFELKSFRLARKNANGSYEALSKSLDEFNSYKANHWRGHKVRSTLFLHSMGNLLLEKAVENHLTDSLSADLFNNIVMNAPAVHRRNHAKWVEKLNFQNNIIINMNHKDFSFSGIWWLTFKRQLGKKTGGKTASNALYVDFSDAAGGEHNYFLNPEIMLLNGNLGEYYRSVFTGHSLEYTDNCFFSREKNYYKLK